MTGLSEPSPASRILHIHSGDSTADAARAAHIPGAHLPFREALADGPAIPQLRAGYAEHQWGINPQEFLEERTKFQQSLRNRFDQIVCWFDRDLFCRVNLWFVLTLLPREGDVWLADSHDPERLHDPPRKLTQHVVNSAVDAWSAYSADDPRGIETLVRGNSIFAEPLRLHLSRFPSTMNGLGVVENRILSLIPEDSATAHDVVNRFIASSEDLGFGDMQIWSAMKRLASGRTPLLSFAADESQVQITAAGENVRRGHADAAKLNGIDLWLGGVHLRGSEPRWRWDGQKLVMSDE